MDSLTKAQREQLAQALSELERTLEQAIADASESTQPVDLDSPIGRVTRIDAIQQQNMAKASQEANRARLKAVLAALNVINSEEYGECVSCGELIPFARLLVRPESRFCVECQEMRE